VHVAAVRTGRGDAGSATMIDVERARSETPGCEHVNHLNNAGASLMPEPVLRAVIDHLELEAKIGGYEAAARQENAWQHTYDALANLINSHRDEVAVVENATRAWDMAFYGLRFATGAPDLRVPGSPGTALLLHRVRRGWHASLIAGTGRLCRRALHDRSGREPEPRPHASALPQRARRRRGNNLEAVCHRRE
jgi:hypothetical protein